MIVAVDIDNTLLLGNGFDLSEKKPNHTLIEQVNQLKASGNYIKIVTARGAYNSTLEERTAKYYQPIKERLDKCGILYDEISFNKEFADIYIDDLAIRPNEVVITKDLSSSFTNNIVTRINDTVIKSGHAVADEYEWYNAYCDKSDIPEILNITRHSLVYEYVEKIGEVDFDRLFHTIDKYRKFPVLNQNSFDIYIANIEVHLSKNNWITNGAKLISELSKLNVKPTFAHGDLSIDNIIPITEGLKFIDPLYCKYRFGSYIIDYAKLLFSIKFYKGDIELFDKLKERIGIGYIDVLIASEAARVATYKPSFSFIAENLINELDERKVVKHFFEGINGWFSFQRLYTDMVLKYPDGAKFVEVGVFTGRSFFYLIVEAINAGKKFDVSAVDSFTFNDYPPNENKNILEVFKENAAKVDYPINIIIGDSSKSADKFEDGSLDFIFLDADHVRERISADIKAWLPKMKKGGILAGHDYCEEHSGVIQAVDEIFGDDFDKSYLDEKCWLKHIQ